MGKNSDPDMNEVKKTRRVEIITVTNPILFGWDVSAINPLPSGEVGGLHQVRMGPITNDVQKP